MTDTGLRVERDADGVATLWLDRPARHNTLTEASWLSMPEVMAELAGDRDVLALIVTGAGGRAFSAGAEVGEFPRVFATPDAAARYNGAVRAAFDAVARFPKPTLALVRGVCIGGGCGLAVACDLRFATPDARLGITPAKLGLAYPVEDTARLVATVGPARAKDLLFTGRLVGADEALAMGLVDRVIPEEDLMAAGRAWLAQVLGNSAYTVRAAKAMVEGALEGRTGDDPVLRSLYDGAFTGEDLAEGVRAFLEKRPPSFTWRG